MRETTFYPGSRTYPPTVTLLRRSDGAQSRVDGPLTIAQVEDWLLSDALRIADPLHLFEGFVWRLVAAGLAIDRATLHVGTLHPQLRGFAWNWNAADALCDEIKVAHDAEKSADYLKSPLAYVITTGQALKLRPDDPVDRARFDLMSDLANGGFTHYVAVPLGVAGYYNVASLSTRKPGGFRHEDFETLKRLFRLLALHVERINAAGIARNIVDTYLGGAAGRQVLEGTIQRGAGTRISAVIWLSDLRGFTDRSDRLAPADMIILLNRYFEAMADAVLALGGEILKFIGDGLLAAFPLDRSYEPGGNAAMAALAAARAADAAVSKLNTDPPDDLAQIADWAPLKSGIALHEGEVFFGNVGASERLDFTVIGAAVNAASRIEALCKPLGRTILMTAEIAAQVAEPMQSLGRHELRGFSEPVEIFTPPA